MGEPMDYHDALKWAVAQLADKANGPVDTLRLHYLKELRDEMQRESRK